MIFNLLFIIFVVLSVFYTVHILLRVLREVMGSRSFPLKTTVCVYVAILIAILWNRPLNDFVDYVLAFTGPLIFAICFDMAFFGARHPKYGVRVFMRTKTNETKEPPKVAN